MNTTDKATEEMNKLTATNAALGQLLDALYNLKKTEFSKYGAGSKKLKNNIPMIIQAIENGSDRINEVFEDYIEIKEKEFGLEL